MNAFSQKNDLELISNGKNFIFKTAELIESAQHFIFIHTYILRFDEVTGPIIAALEASAKKGVRIYFIVDAFGSKHLTESQLNIFKRHNIHFTFFEPLKYFNHVGRRLHQKVVIVDNQKAIIGGINMAKEYNLPDKSAPWLDYACLLKGEEINNVFQKVLPLYLKAFPEQAEFLKSLKQYQAKPEIKTCLVKTNINDWMRYKNEVYKSYITAIRGAEKSIYLLATYFIPGKKLLKELKNARKRGVDINLIFGSHSDHPIIQKVEYYFYKWYLLNQITIYEWQESVVHGKIALIDEKWVTIGSYNHNYISRFGNLELNLEVINRDFAKTVKDEFDRIVSLSKKCHIHQYESRFSFVDKIYSVSSYLFLNIITLISLIFIYRRSK